MKPQLHKKTNNLDNIIEESVLSKKSNDLDNKNNAKAIESNIVFLLENNLLSQLGKLEEKGYEFTSEHKNQYDEKLYESILLNPDETIRQYLKQDIELPGKFLAMCFLVDMQKSIDKDGFALKKTIMSFIDKVKKGLQTDPVAKYKIEKLKDKEFVHEIFDVWYDSSIKHFADIKKHVVNKKKFLWFYFNKSKSTMTKDIHNFTDNILQKHILNHELYFQIPVINEFFLQSLGVEKLAKVKDIIQLHDEVYNMLESSTSNMHTSTARSWCRHIRIAEIELENVVVKELDKQLHLYYEQQGNHIVNNVKDMRENSVTNNINKKIEKKPHNELPNEAIKMVEEINTIGNKLYHKTIDEETKDTIEFLCKENLQEVINKYLDIDSSYRQNLKNVQGKNAQELMMESLTIIKESLDLIEKDINEENLKNLSIHTRYLKKSLKN